MPVVVSVVVMSYSPGADLAASTLIRYSEPPVAGSRASCDAAVSDGFGVQDYDRYNTLSAVKYQLPPDAVRVWTAVGYAVFGGVSRTRTYTSKADMLLLRLMLYQAQSEACASTNYAITPHTLG